ncbi:MAG: hypothetical protein H7831_13525 [Magnetococcus sp. WYHC-3]
MVSPARSKDVEKEDCDREAGLLDYQPFRLQVQSLPPPGGGGLRRIGPAADVVKLVDTLS